MKEGRIYKKETLSNGLKVITSNMPHMESVSIGLWIGVGGRYEPKPQCGMSHLMEHMLFKGTVSRTANMLKEAIEGIGGSFNGFTTEEVTCYLVKLPSAHTELGLDVLSDMVLNPELDPVELEKEKYVICEEIKMYMDQPGHHVFDILIEAMWPNHALGRPIAGYIQSVKNFKREDLIEFKAAHYQPANMCVVATGKLGKRQETLDFIKNIFFMPSTKKRFACEPIKSENKGVKTTLTYKDTKQTHIVFGFHSIERTHKLRYVLLLLNIILGGNMSSRLFERLREKKALCYEISSSIKNYKETGAFVIHAGVDNAKLLEASEEIINELKDMKKNPASADELERAKEYCRGQLLLALEDTGMRMVWLGERIMIEGGKAPTVREIFENIDKVTVEDVRNLANLIFNKKNLNFATIGPARSSLKVGLKKVLVL